LPRHAVAVVLIAAGVALAAPSGADALEEMITSTRTRAGRRAPLIYLYKKWRAMTPRIWSPRPGLLAALIALPLAALLCAALLCAPAAADEPTTPGSAPPAVTAWFEDTAPTVAHDVLVADATGLGSDQEGVYTVASSSSRSTIPIQG